MTTNIVVKRAKFLRLFAQTADEPTGNDTDFGIVDSEDGIEVTSKRDVQKYNTKGHDIIKDAGSPDTQIKLTAQSILASDPGLDAIQAAFDSGVTLPIQVRDVEASPNLVAMEGLAIVSELDTTLDPTGLVSYSITIEVSGPWTRNIPARALTSGT